MHLLERGGVMRRLDELLGGARDGGGRAVLIRGEAGIGKTSVVRAFTTAHSNDSHTLWGGCDDLLTARPLGPIWDMAIEEPTLGDALRRPDRYEAFSALLELMTRALRPTIVAIEDIHWADEATLDLIKFLGRRIDRTHGLLLVTYRDGEVPGDLPLRPGVCPGYHEGDGRVHRHAQLQQPGERVPAGQLQRPRSGEVGTGREKASARRDSHLGGDCGRSEQQCEGEGEAWHDGSLATGTGSRGDRAHSRGARGSRAPQEPTRAEPT